MRGSLRFGSALLAMVLVFVLLPVKITAEEAASDYGFSGKTISILGDSISTYTGVSQGAGAQTTNSTIGSNALYYSAGRYGVYQPDTWWQQTADTLGMRVLVNNSWSGSCILSANGHGSASMGYTDRSVNLHDDTGDNAGEEPDIIAVFLGTNDFSNYKSTLGTAAAVDYETLIQETDDGYTYKTPATAAEAYAIMLYRMTRRYPNAEVYCLSLLPRVGQSAANATLTLQFNDTIKTIASHYGACFVDLYNDSGIVETSEIFYHYMGDTLHPKPAGMDAMTNCVVSAMLKNSRYSTVKNSLHTVSYDLDGVTVTQGTVKTAVAGQSFSISMEQKAGYALDVTVTMGNEDITQSSYADGTVTIASVTGDIRITAAHVIPQRELTDFRWEFSGGELVNVTTHGNSENALTRLAGTTSGSTFSNTRYRMATAIQLKHNKPWSVEWKSTGSWSNSGSGGLLFAAAEVSTTEDAPYFYRRYNSEFLALGVRSGGQYYNYGASLKGTGINATEEHVYRMTNRIAEDGSNMVYLYVDNAQIGPMNHYYNGGTDKNETVNWVAGKDFVFQYLGTVGHSLDNCAIEYIQVWENGTALYKGAAEIVKADGTTVESQSREEALSKAQSGQTVQLCKDTQVDDISVSVGVTLDLNGHSLTADSLIAFKGGYVVDHSESGSGLLKVDPERLILPGTREQLPVWNGTDGFVFTRHAIYQEVASRTDSEIVLKFTVFFEANANAWLADGASDNHTIIAVKVTWDGETEAGDGELYLKYNDKMVGQVIGDSSKAYRIRFYDYQEYQNLTITPVVRTESGALAEGAPVAVTGAQ